MSKEILDVWQDISDNLDSPGESDPAQKLREFRVLMDLAPYPIIVHIDLIIAYANRSAVALAGLGGLEALIGRSIFDFVHPEDRPLVKSRLQRHREGEEVLEHVEERITTTATQVKHVELRSRTVRFGGKDAIMVIGREISDRKKFEEERQGLLERMREDVKGAAASSGIIPSCASCRKIRDGDDSWMDIERYLEKRLNARFSHGICPGCATKVYPELFDQKPGRGC